MKQIVAGIVAHVDAGKTTLSEALLYRTGEIRKLGRVDHGDAFLDTNSLEKARGITIFAHQALVEHGDLRLTLLDTPGHVDFAAETERVLRVLDYAILVVSGTDGVQGHTETLWRLLARYGVPTFIFVNKCDAAGFDREAILAQLRKRLSDAIYPLPAMEQSTEGSAVPLDALAEDIATLDEEAMNDYLEHGALSVDRLRSMIAVRELFPVYFGSALKLEGVEEFLDGLETFTREREWPAAFESPVTDGEYAVIEGEAPVSEMRDYAMDVNQYTHGHGRFSATFGGYKPCHDAEQIIAAAAYDPEADLDNTPDSVFCAHGAGYPVKWYKVPEFAHVDYAM